MKNITKQYQDLLEGKMSKDNFMRSVRRDFPQWISPVNSFNDAVNILKSKRILNENINVATKWASLEPNTLDAILAAAGVEDVETREILGGFDYDTMTQRLPNHVDASEVDKYIMNPPSDFMRRRMGEADAGSPSGPIGGENQAGARHVAKMWDSLSDEAREKIIQVAGTFHDFGEVEKLAGMDFDAMMAAMPPGQGSVNKLYNAIKQAAEDESTFSQMQANRGFNPNNPGQGSTLEGITEVSDDTVEQDLKNLRAMGYTYEDAITAVAAILDMDYDELADEYPQDRIDTEGHEYQQGPEDDAERGDFDDWRQGMKETITLEPELEAALKQLDKDGKKSLVFWLKDKLAGKKAEPKTAGIDAQDPYGSGLPIGSSMFQVTEKKALKEAAEKPEGRYKEATGKAEYDKFAEMDRVNYRQLMKGMEYELLKMPEITDENLIKAKKKAYSNLIKNPKAYLDLLVRNEKEVEKRDKDLRMQAVKKDNLADKANAMKVLKKDESSNTQTNQSNKEKAKGMPQGVKVMKESFVEQLRHYILSEMIEVGSPKTSFRIGEMVKTPEGEVGTVEEVTPDNTAKIKLESGAVVEYQGNVLEAHEADLMMQEDEPDMRSSDYDDSSFQAFSKEKDAAVSNETATNRYGDTFEVGKTAITHDNKELKITGFTKEQGKIKARYNAGTSAGLYDIDGLSKKEDKHTALKEKLANSLKEADDSPEEIKAKNLQIAAEKAKITAANKKIQDLNKTGI